MLEISKEVAHRLHNEYGIRWKDGGISSTSTSTYKKNKKYYLCESEYNLRNLLKITDSEKAKKLLEECKGRRRFSE